ncbi:small ribosomal subunit protein uS13m [Quercus suber]|uniref:Small ribosomal subunit protein s13 n=1 Tax=Quercus suber TaxID=58331 RepID=A0AAW0IR91_QUESU|nr:small ribosomal subunit protein S13, mitochondrial-like [Quercus suber]XP_023893588.1 small ribosomal subunit protein S13, mitochondrial-like [Quercus suber]XP_023893589.1 small ribosomal subunit protein S13, mitochondrial-like [Quercus suber]
MAFSSTTKHSASLGTFLYNGMLNSGCASQSQRSCGLANAIASVRSVSDIGLRLLPNLSFHGVRIQCINIGGGKGEIPDNKHLQIALQHIHGIGRSRACQILSKLSIENKLARELTGRELYALREELNNYMCAHELNNQVTKDIARLMEIQCYRGIRHSQGLPCRGQRTHTNARTWKGKAIPVAGKKKA